MLRLHLLDAKGVHLLIPLPLSYLSVIATHKSSRARPFIPSLCIGPATPSVSSPLYSIVTEPPNYDGPHVPVIVIMTSDNRTYVPHNLKGLLSSEQDLITGVLQYYNSLFKILSE
jgi:hypothetical protein